MDSYKVGTPAEVAYLCFHTGMLRLIIEQYTVQDTLKHCKGGHVRLLFKPILFK